MKRLLLLRLPRSLNTKNIYNETAIGCDDEPLTSNPDPKSFRFFEAEHLFERILEGEIESLGWEISQDVVSISSPDWTLAFSALTSQYLIKTHSF